MKTLLTKTQANAWSLLLGLVGLTQTAGAKDLTAFELIQEGNRFIGEQSKDKVVQVRSDKSVGSLKPDVWHLVYYDPDATLKAVEVKFRAGQKLDVKRPVRLLEPITRADVPLSKEKLKVDSDKALEVATQQPSLEKLTLKASRLIVERRSIDDDTPVWKVRLWAAKVKNPNDDVEVGEVILSAEDGKVLKLELKPERVN